MDGSSGKRAASRFILSTERSRLVLRDTLNDKDLDAPFGNRLGCNGRLNFSRTNITRSSFGSSSCSTKIDKNSTRTCSAIRNADNSMSKPLRILSSELETASSETNSMQDEPEDSGSVPIPLAAKCKRVLQVNSRDIKSADFKMMEVGSSSGASNVKPLRKFGKQCEGINQDPATVSSFSFRFRSSGQGKMHVRSSRNKELDQSSSDQSLKQRKDVTEQIRCEGESRFPFRGKKIGGSSSGRNSKKFMADARRAGNITPKIANCHPSVSGTSSNNCNPIAMTSLSPPIGNLIPLHESSSAVYQMPEPDLSIETNTSSSAHRYSSAQASRSVGNLRSTRPSWPGEVAMRRPLISSDDFRGLHIDEVLMALERLQQDEELTYEQVFLLENNLFLSGLNFGDQHRDMRLDIDNMSYEELLALEEKMGSVSLALSEEEMAKCLKRSMYHSTPGGGSSSRCDDSDDFKCCICQEEYGDEDEIGSLQCKHKFHASCIQRWLQLKNWCPVCKSSANS